MVKAAYFTLKQHVLFEFRLYYIMNDNTVMLHTLRNVCSSAHSSWAFAASLTIAQSDSRLNMQANRLLGMLVIISTSE